MRYGVRVNQLADPLLTCFVLSPKPPVSGGINAPHRTGMPRRAVRPHGLLIDTVAECFASDFVLACGDGVTTHVLDDLCPASWDESC